MVPPDAAATDQERIIRYVKVTFREDLKMTRTIAKVIASTATALLLATTTNAQDATTKTAAPQTTIDPHALYEQRCGSCHYEHGADLARKKLKIVDGTIRIARTGKAVESLLAQHHGVTLTSEETAALVGLFDIGLRSKGVFQKHCALCHTSGVTFTRKSIAVKDGRLYARKAGTEIGPFLGQHSRATPSEIELLIEMMKYQLRTKPKT
ncbi:MAG: hypothetical protein JNM89_00530 [Hyphomicrobiaceae bacterium]|nr:hypothetical protein [Hyphomicrobiaceae bacterium]